jgi:hypothetical protein
MAEGPVTSLSLNWDHAKANEGFFTTCHSVF